jgi:glyoxylase-like metal-dependent hydrolase (beta-lactamase superfamily II)
MLVDTGGPSDRDFLLAALSAHNLTPRDIACVVCTHGHVDHVGNANLFPHATFLSGQDRAVGDRFWPLDFTAGPVTIDTGIRVMASPGHTSEDISVLVDTRDGVVAVAGDVFENGNPTDTVWRAYSRNPRQQHRSQAALLAIANAIVPGHGLLFTVAEYSARTASCSR